MLQAATVAATQARVAHSEFDHSEATTSAFARGDRAGVEHGLAGAGRAGTI